MAKKVCILTSAHPVFDTRIFHKQAITLAKAGYNVVLIAQHEKDEIVNGIKIVALPKPHNRLQRMFGLVFKVFYLALKQKAQVYHFHDPELLPICLITKIITRAKVIYDVHENVKKDILSKEWIPKLFRKSASKIYLIFEKIIINVIDHVIIAEESYIKNYRNYPRLSTIRNYPLLEYIQDIRKVNYGDQAEPKFLIYAGAITKIRGAVELIESLNIILSSGHTNVYLKIFGSISQELKEELYNIGTKYNITSHFTIPGEISHSDVFIEISKSDIGLAILHPQPNYIESIPTKLFEYMSVGLPLISSNFAYWKEFVEASNCGLTVDPLNPKEIAKAIIYLIERPDLMQEMGRNGRKMILEKYNWEIESRKLLSLYEQILNNNKTTV